MTVFRQEHWPALKPVVCKSYIAQTISSRKCSQSMAGKKEKSENLGNRRLDVGNSIKERFRAIIGDFTESIKRVASEPENGTTLKGWQQLIEIEPGSEGATCKGSTDGQPQ